MPSRQRAGRADAFVAKINPAGQALVYSTYLGGSGSDYGVGMAVDNDRNAYVAGVTFSNNFPTKNAFQAKNARPNSDNAFVTKFNPTGNALVYSTYLGGQGGAGAHAIAVDGVGDAYVTGDAGERFPTKNPFQAKVGGNIDAFVAKLSTLQGAALINVAVFSECQGGPCGFATAGGGAPCSGLIGVFQSPDIQFATTTGFNWHPFGQTTFGADMAGVLDVPTTDTYTFTLTSDDGILLLIDGSVVVDNGGPHPPMTESGSATLLAGAHSFEVQFFECCGPPSGIDLDLPSGVTFGFAGTPGEATCHGESVAALTQQFGSLHAAASALGFASVKTLQDAIRAFCEE